MVLSVLYTLANLSVSVFSLMLIVFPVMVERRRLDNSEVTISLKVVVAFYLVALFSVFVAQTMMWLAKGAQNNSLYFWLGYVVLCFIILRLYVRSVFDMQGSKLRVLEGYQRSIGSSLFLLISVIGFVVARSFSKYVWHY